MRDSFALSCAWLGVYRVLIGALLLLDVIGRSRSLIAHYTDVGVLPREVVRAQLLEPGYWSLHLWTGDWPGQAALLLVAIVCAVLLMFGVRPRLLAGACYLLVASIGIRNPMLVTGGDHLLRVMLFWSMFVPLGPVHGPEQLGAREAEARVRTVASWGTAAFIVQLCCMYSFSFLLKTGAPWREDFSAVAQALAFEHYTTPTGLWLLAHARVLPVLTIAVMLLESLGPLLLLIPWRRDVWRTLIVAAFCAFHLGTAATMELGLFPWICMSCWIALLPDTLAERLAALLPAGLRARARSWSTARPYRLGRAASIVVASLLAYVLAWNVRTLDLQRYQEYFPREYSGLGRLLRLDQNWRLFTPSPPDDRGWFVIPVHLADGQSYDHLTARPITWAKPPLISALYPDHRWRKYFLNFRDDARADLRPYFGDWLCRRDPDIVRVEVFYVLDQPDAREMFQLLDHRCADGSP